VTKLPGGTVTFLFTDIEGSTRLLQDLGDAYADELAKHRAALRRAFATHGGVEVDTQGDAFFVAFARSTDALDAADVGQKALGGGPIRVRMGLHTGEPLLTKDGYVGIDVHRAARIAAAGHGGQILLSQSTRDLARPDLLRDLGEHRLKDLTAPERIYQLGDGDFPPLKSLNQTNLPVQPTPFVGRERELQAVLELLGSSRLLTLTGAGGSGKTRLALQAAAEVADDFGDGTWFVPLASITKTDLFLPTIASTVGAKGDLHEFLRPRRVLLVLDNLEQLLPDVAPRVAELLTLPHVCLLATSRERVAIKAEQEYPVPTLVLHEAVSLFSARARQLRPGFESDEYVTEIARRLDGLPLALELAAARVKVLNTEQILQRLGSSLDLLTAGARDAPPRQRTLRGTIEWSYQLLSSQEQRLFPQLGVFSGSFNLESAEEICAADLDTLQGLVDKSLIRRTEEGRFFMLETIKDFAFEQLEQSKAEELRRRHVDHFRSFAEQAAASFGGAEQAEWMQRLELEHDNLRAALAVARDQADAELLLRLSSALWKFWSVHSHWQEGRGWLHAALKISANVRTPLRAQVLEGAADLAWRQGSYAEGRALLDESLSLWRELGNRRGATSALHFRGNLESASGNNVEARRLWLEAQEAWRELGDSERFAATVMNLGLAALAEGEVDEAAALFGESLTLARSEGFDFIAAISLHGLGFALLRTAGREDEGADLLREALNSHKRLGHKEAVVICLIGLAEAAELAGNCRRATRLLGAAEGLTEEIGFSFQADLRRDHERLRGELTSRLGPEDFAAACAEGREFGPERAVEYALADRD
jgi:predicted ATPase